MSIWELRALIEAAIPAWLLSLIAALALLFILLVTWRRSRSR